MPSKVGLSSSEFKICQIQCPLARKNSTRLTRPVHRLNTYPLIHLGFIHMLLNSIALAPLLERFEAEHGTLVSAAFFGGRMRFFFFTHEPWVA